MKRRMFSVLISLCCLLAIVMIGCSGDSSTNSGTANLTGSVHVLGGTTVVSDVAVSAQWKSTTTDATGHFELRSLQPGQTAVVLMKQGFISATINVNLVPGANSFSIAIQPAP